MPQQGASSEPKYLYCIIRASEPQRFTTLGIGERGDTVYTVHNDELAAVVSDTPHSEYERSRRNMMAHTVVLEEVMETFTILPIRFNTAAPDVASIQQKLLGLRHDELAALLDSMEDHIELGLKAFWFQEVIFQEILDENVAIRDLRDRLVGRSAEETYYERIRLGEMIEKCMLEKREADEEKILTTLRQLASKTKAKDTISDRMVVNAAFLVRRDRQADFDAAIFRLDEEQSERFLFKYVGPVPPYNFVSVLINW
jgi:hypothetical protein